jgi:prevent-host-death family protein
MKVITVEELHQQTTEVVREAAREEIVVTENGKPVAVLKGLPNGSDREHYWHEREHKLSALPRLDSDSTIFISEDRDRG